MTYILSINTDFLSSEPNLSLGFVEPEPPVREATLDPEPSFREATPPGVQSKSLPESRAKAGATNRNKEWRGMDRVKVRLGLGAWLG